MKESILKKITYLYIGIPVFIFLLGWLKWFIAIPISIALAIGMVGVWKCIDENNIKISKKILLVTFLLAAIWCILSGQGGYYYQSADYDARNAIFRDLIMRPWPVTYPEENMGMIYYIGQWLVPAMFGKAMLSMFGEAVAWNVANFVLLLWGAIGITIVFLLLYKVVGADSTKKKIMTVFGMVFFSGLDVIGIGLQCITNRRLILIDHIECWSTVAEYSSMTTCLLWVFNQTIVPWIIILLYLSGEKKRNYAFLGILCTLYGPLPAIGLLPFMLGSAVWDLMKCKSGNERLQFFKEIFSAQNLIATVFIFPVMLIYYSGNYTWSASSINYLSNSSWGNMKTILVLIVFVVLEFGLYALCICKFYLKDKNYYFMVISLLMVLVYQVGSASDFSRRASIPSLLVLLCMVIKVIINLSKSNGNTFSRLCIMGLCTCYIVGMVTPLVEYGRGIYHMASEKKICLVQDDMKTLEGKEQMYTGNFVTYDLNSNIFFNYLGKSK